MFNITLNYKLHNTVYINFYLLANCSKEDNLEVIGNWNGKETIFFCRVIDPGDKSSEAYPRMGITVPSVAEPNEFSDMPLPSLQLKV